MNYDSDSDAKNDKTSNPTIKSVQTNGVKLIEDHKSIITLKDNLAFFMI